MLVILVAPYGLLDHVSLLEHMPFTCMAACMSLPTRLMLAHACACVAACAGVRTPGMEASMRMHPTLL